MMRILNLATDRFRNQKLIVQSLRTGIFALILLFALSLHLSQSQFFNWNLFWYFYTIGGLGVFANGLALLARRQFYQRPLLVWASFFGDVFLISVLLFKTELNISIFLFSYLLEIIMMALIFQTRGALLLAAFASFCFSASSILGPDIKAMTFFYSLILYNVAFFAMAWVSGMMGEQLELQGVSLNTLRALTESIVETIPSGLLTVDSQEVIVTSNPGAELLFKQTLLGFPIAEVFPALSPILRNVREKKLPQKLEVPLVREGDNLIFSTQVLPQQADDNILVIIDDVTEVRRLELTLLHQQKLAAIGGLASGIAHELGNPLAAVSANIQYLEPKIRIDDETDTKLIRNTHREIARLGRLIGEFKDFAKPERVPIDRIQLARIVHEVLDLLKKDPAFRPEIIVQLDVLETPEIRGSADKLLQALLNVVLNAVHALVGVANPRLQISLRVVGMQVVLRIRDNGIGMSDETKSRLFEPFFTTKGKQGTGLGLAITYKILQSHQAQVAVDSTKGQGTEFVFRFPIAPAV